MKNPPFDSLVWGSLRLAPITASDDSCIRGGLHGYKATGHAREKPNLPICACEIGDLEIGDLEITSVDAKHHGASLSERWNVTWVGNNSVCTH